jgi:hypothetical protein
VITLVLTVDLIVNLPYPEQIISVNGKSCVNVTHGEAVEIIRMSGNSPVFVVERINKITAPEPTSVSGVERPVDPTPGKFGIGLSRLVEIISERSDNGMDRLNSYGAAPVRLSCMRVQVWPGDARQSYRFLYHVSHLPARVWPSSSSPILTWEFRVMKVTLRPVCKNLVPIVYQVLSRRLSGS